MLSSHASSPTISEIKSLTALIRSPLQSFHLLQILARIFILGVHRNNFLVTVLIGRLHCPEQSINLLRLLPRPNIIPFNAAIRVLSDSSPNTALSLFLSLKRLSLTPNDFTFSEVFRACSLSRNAFHVFQFHSVVSKSVYSSDTFVSNALLSAYAKGIGQLDSAHRVFGEMPDRKSVCAWTCLITWYARSNYKEEALSFYIDMIKENLTPQDDTMVSVLSACSSLQGKKLEKWVNIIEEFTNHDSAITVLTYLYAKLGKIDESMDLFDKLRKKKGGAMSIVAWNAVIIGHMQNVEPVEALNIFKCLLSYSTPQPNHVTIVSLLSVCAMMGDINHGRWAHEYMKSRGMQGVLVSNKILATAFIDMYSKCGCLKEAKQVFDGMNAKDVVSFNAMIMGLAMNGEGMEALNLFSNMGKLNVKPNDGTFLGLLFACAHSGMVNEGRLIFSDMQKKYLICPKLEHFACFTNLLARANFIEEALNVVETMPIKPNGLVWGSLLGACLVYFKADIAREVSRRFFDADSENSAGYVMLSNIYAMDQSWEDIEGLRGLMMVRGVRKQPGCSWISINGCLHAFHAGTSSVPEMEMLHCLLDSLYRELR